MLCRGFPISRPASTPSTAPCRLMVGTLILGCAANRASMAHSADRRRRCRSGAGTNESRHRQNPRLSNEPAVASKVASSNAQVGDHIFQSSRANLAALFGEPVTAAFGVKIILIPEPRLLLRIGRLQANSQCPGCCSRRSSQGRLPAPATAPKPRRRRGRPNHIRQAPPSECEAHPAIPSDPARARPARRSVAYPPTGSVVPP